MSQHFPFCSPVSSVSSSESLVVEECCASLPRPMIIDNDGDGDDDSNCAPRQNYHHIKKRQEVNAVTAESLMIAVVEYEKTGGNDGEGDDENRHLITSKNANHKWFLSDSQIDPGIYAQLSPSSPHDFSCVLKHESGGVKFFVDVDCVSCKSAAPQSSQTCGANSHISRSQIKMLLKIVRKIGGSDNMFGPSMSTTNAAANNNLYVTSRVNSHGFHLIAAGIRFDSYSTYKLFLGEIQRQWSTHYPNSLYKFDAAASASLPFGRRHVLVYNLNTANNCSFEKIVVEKLSDDERIRLCRFLSPIVGRKNGDNYDEISIDSTSGRFVYTSSAEAAAAALSKSVDKKTNAGDDDNMDVAEEIIRTEAARKLCENTDKVVCRTPEDLASQFVDTFGFKSMSKSMDTTMGYDEILAKQVAKIRDELREFTPLQKSVQDWLDNNRDEEGDIENDKSRLSPLQLVDITILADFDTYITQDYCRKEFDELLFAYFEQHFLSQKFNMLVAKKLYFENLKIVQPCADDVETSPEVGLHFMYWLVVRCCSVRMFTVILADITKMSQRCMQDSRKIVGSLIWFLRFVLEHGTNHAQFGPLFLSVKISAENIRQALHVYRYVYFFVPRIEINNTLAEVHPGGMCTYLLYQLYNVMVENSRCEPRHTEIIIMFHNLIGSEFVVTNEDQQQQQSKDEDVGCSGSGVGDNSRNSTNNEQQLEPYEFVPFDGDEFVKNTKNNSKRQEEDEKKKNKKKKPKKQQSLVSACSDKNAIIVTVPAIFVDYISKYYFRPFQFVDGIYVFSNTKDMYVHVSMKSDNDWSFLNGSYRYKINFQSTVKPFCQARQSAAIYRTNVLDTFDDLKLNPIKTFLYYNDVVQTFEPMFGTNVAQMVTRRFVDTRCVDVNGGVRPEIINTTALGIKVLSDLHIELELAGSRIFFIQPIVPLEIERPDIVQMFVKAAYFGARLMDPTTKDSTLAKYYTTTTTTAANNANTSSTNVRLSTSAEENLYDPAVSLDAKDFKKFISNHNGVSLSTLNLHNYLHLIDDFVNQGCERADDDNNIYYLRLKMFVEYIFRKVLLGKSDTDQMDEEKYRIEIVGNLIAWCFALIMNTFNELSSSFEFLSFITCLYNVQTTSPSIYATRILTMIADRKSHVFKFFEHAIRKSNTNVAGDGGGSAGNYGGVGGGNVCFTNSRKRTRSDTNDDEDEEKEEYRGEKRRKNNEEENAQNENKRYNEWLTNERIIFVNESNCKQFYKNIKSALNGYVGCPFRDGRKKIKVTHDYDVQDKIDEEKSGESEVMLVTRKYKTLFPPNHVSPAIIDVYRMKKLYTDIYEITGGGNVNRNNAGGGGNGAKKQQRRNNNSAVVDHLTLQKNAADTKRCVDSALAKLVPYFEQYDGSRIINGDDDENNYAAANTKTTQAAEWREIRQSLLWQLSTCTNTTIVMASFALFIHYIKRYSIRNGQDTIRQTMPRSIHNQVARTRQQIMRFVFEITDAIYPFSFFVGKANVYRDTALYTFSRVVAKLQPRFVQDNYTPNLVVEKTASATVSSTEIMAGIMYLYGVSSYSISMTLYFLNLFAFIERLGQHAKVFFAFSGRPSSGKSMLQEILCEYAAETATIPPAQNSALYQPEMKPCTASMIVVYDEVSALMPCTIKRLTSPSGQITFRNIQSNSVVSCYMSPKVFYSWNTMPFIPPDMAFDDRMQIIPFSQTITAMPNVFELMHRWLPSYLYTPIIKLINSTPEDKLRNFFIHGKNPELVLSTQPVVSSSSSSSYNEKDVDDEFATNNFVHKKTPVEQINYFFKLISDTLKQSQSLGTLLDQKKKNTAGGNASNNNRIENAKNETTVVCPPPPFLYCYKTYLASYESKLDTVTLAKVLQYIVRHHVRIVNFHNHEKPIDIKNNDIKPDVMHIAKVNWRKTSNKYYEWIALIKASTSTLTGGQFVAENLIKGSLARFCQKNNCSKYEESFMMTFETIHAAFRDKNRCGYNISVDMSTLLL